MLVAQHSYRSGGSSGTAKFHSLTTSQTITIREAAALVNRAQRHWRWAYSVAALPRKFIISPNWSIRELGAVPKDTWESEAWPLSLGTFLAPDFPRLEHPWIRETEEQMPTSFTWYFWRGEGTWQAARKGFGWCMYVTVMGGGVVHAICKVCKSRTNSMPPSVRTHPISPFILSLLPFTPHCILVYSKATGPLPNTLPLSASAFLDPPLIASEIARIRAHAW